MSETAAAIKPHITLRSLGREMSSWRGGRDNPRLGDWRPKLWDADGDTLLDLPDLRAKCRDLTRTAPVATGAIGTTVTHTIGTGLALQPTIDAEALGLSEEQTTAWRRRAVREWKLFWESTDCDVGRRLNGYGLQALALRSSLDSGDVFVLLPEVERPGKIYRLSVQLIEADRVCNQNFAADTDTMVAGVMFDGSGGPTGYKVARKHPFALRGAGNVWDTVMAFGEKTGRRNILHIGDQLRPGQTRGIPLLAPVIEHVKQLARYAEAELQAAVVSGVFSVFLRMDPEAFRDLFDDDARDKILDVARKWDGTLQAGKVVNLLPGEEPVSSNPGRPNAAFDPFVVAIMTQIGMALEIPYEVLMMRFDSSYSASRAALLSAWRLFRCRRENMAIQFCQPIYETWLTEAVARGRLPCPGFFADPAIRAAWCSAMWVGDGPGSIDPQKEVAAAQKRVDMGISTLEAESLLYDGGDWQAKHAQRVRERNARVADGLEQPDEPAKPAAKTTAETASA